MTPRERTVVMAVAERQVEEIVTLIDLEPDAAVKLAMVGVAEGWAALHRAVEAFEATLERVGR